MAFNPFSVFRRNQKSLFAVLTVFVMFMFVLSFGRGDFFEWLPRWLGSKKSYGDLLAVVDGSKVYQSDLNKRRNERVLANQYMLQAFMVARDNNAKVVQDGQGSVSEQSKQAIEFALRLHRGLTGQEQLDPQTLNLFVQIVQGQLAELLAKTDLPKDDQEVVRAARDLITRDLQALSMRGGDSYFVNQPSTTDNDLLEFELWLKKADQLGIDYQSSDARMLVEREFSGRVPEEDLRRIENEFQKNKQNYSREALYAAIANEFKVRSAQSVVLGPVGSQQSALAPQAFNSPYESYKFFREQSVGGTYGLISFPVENFVSQVQGQPSEGELREIFQKYRNAEPNPATETPGLKEPRKLKLGWLEVRGDEPYYVSAAKSTLEKAETQAKLAGFFVAPLGQASFGYLAAPAGFIVQEPSLQAAYNEYKQRFAFEVDTNMFPSIFGTHKPVGTSVVKPENLVAAAGASAGSLLTGASLFTAPLVFEQRVASNERDQRARVQAALFTVPITPGAGLEIPLGAVAAATARMPKPLPLDVLRPDLLKKAEGQLARKLAEQDLELFQTEMSKLGAEKDKAQVKEYLAKFAAERGLKVGGSEQFRDRFAIDKDPGLQVLKEKMERGHSMANAPLRFGDEFFFEQDFRTRRMVPTSSFYSPQPYPSTGMSLPGMATPIVLREGEPSYLVWRSEEIPAEAPRTFDAAREKALAAWKMMKARELAQKAAEEAKAKAETFGEQAGVIDQKVRDLHTEVQQRFEDPAAREKVKYFIIDNVCPRPPYPTFGSNMAMGREQYEPFSLRPTKDLPYPTQDILNQLIDNKDKPLSTALMFPDAGKNTFYVAVLKDRRDVGIDMFVDRVYTGTNQLAEMINQEQQLTLLGEARRDAVALLKAEFRVEKESEKLLERSQSFDE